MSIVVKNNILWVGQRDWEVRDFHGTEYKKRCAAAATTAISSAKRKKRADRYRRS
ncbi:Anaerobic nitric oxide reductase flavorubredoxin [Klebsiella pneumoniae ISC21]|nr:Anaerobic nitric oxide reductase flavorubredoxin [Klebsiella pneumoniae ISC21]